MSQQEFQQLQRQLDYVQSRVLEGEAEDLGLKYEALHGKSLPIPLLKEAVKQSMVTSVHSKPVDPSAQKERSEGVKPLLKIFGKMSIGASAWLMMAGSFGKWGEGVDRLINLNGYFLTAGVLLLTLGGSVHVGFKHVGERLSGGGIKKKSRLLSWTLPMMCGAMVATTVGITVCRHQEEIGFDMYTARLEATQNLLSSLPEVSNSEAQSVAHGSALCQSFREDLRLVDAQPASILGNVINQTMAAGGYEKGCLIETEFFAEGKAHHRRASAQSQPHLLPILQDRLEKFIIPYAGISEMRWCMVTHEWPKGIEPAVRSSACSAVPMSMLSKPMTLKQMGIDVATYSPKPSM